MRPLAMRSPRFLQVPKSQRQQADITQKRAKEEGAGGGFYGLDLVNICFAFVA